MLCSGRTNTTGFLEILEIQERHGFSKYMTKALEHHEISRCFRHFICSCVYVGKFYHKAKVMVKYVT